MSNYTEMIAKILKLKNEADVKEICLAIAIVDGVYQLSFINEETEDLLNIIYIDQNGCENCTIINKKYIIDVSIIQEDNIDEIKSQIFSKEEEKDKNNMFG